MPLSPLKLLSTPFAKLRLLLFLKAWFNSRLDQPKFLRSQCPTVIYPLGSVAFNGIIPNVGVSIETLRIQRILNNRVGLEETSNLRIVNPPIC